VYFSRSKSEKSSFEYETQEPSNELIGKSTNQERDYYYVDTLVPSHCLDLDQPTTQVRVSVTFSGRHHLILQRRLQIIISPTN